MPLHEIHSSGDACGWGIWHITEPEGLLEQAAFPDLCPSDITSRIKRQEWAAGRVLAKTLATASGLAYRGIIKDEPGKPHLIGHRHFISLSNTHPYVGAQLDAFHPVGIDIEQPKDKLLKIAPRVFNTRELKDAGADVIKTCVYWSAKEALFKIHGRKGLSFSENLAVHPFNLQSEGLLHGKIVVGSAVTRVSMHYRVTPDFVLVFTNGVEEGT